MHSSGRLWLYRSMATIALVLLVILAYLLFKPDPGQSLRYATAEVAKGDLTITVTATGSVQPVNQVDVGSELSGIVEAVYVDFNDRVTRGQVLARLNTDGLNALVIEGRASLESAKAKLEEMKATVLETSLRFQRCEKLATRQLCSDEELATAQAGRARAIATQTSARAQIAVAQAALEANEANLAKAVIRSPIDGLVLQRQVEPGQTVAASLQAPVLFTLAEDLAQMEVHVAVDEADVGKVSESQSAVFTVDAYPDRQFPARITQVRFYPQTIDGVVTYETLLAVDNSDLSLRPGMTATAVITVAQLTDVALLPNAALRFTPPAAQSAQSGGSGLFGSMFRAPRPERRRPETDGKASTKVWVLGEEGPRAVAVDVGDSDGKYTELRAGEIEPGQAVIVDSLNAGK